MCLEYIEKGNEVGKWGVWKDYSVRIIWIWFLYPANLIVAFARDMPEG